MKKISKVLFTLMVLPLLAVSCDIYDFGEKHEKYVAAEKPAVAEVYFANTLASSYNLKGNTGTLSIPINRVNSENQLTVEILSVADPIFQVPANVTFAAGSKEANIDIKFDPADIVSGTNYAFELYASGETAEYGDHSYAFTATLPAAWVKWKKGHMTEGWWSEEEDEYLYYQELGNGIRYCYIENCFDTEGSAEPTNYYFYWDTNTNYLSIPMQYMGYTNSTGKVYVGDPEAFYRDVYDYDDDLLIRNGYEGVADYAYGSNPRPYYDGNGGFYFYVWYFFDKETKPGSGYDFGSNFDLFVAQGFDRKTNYNEAFAYKAAFVGYAESEGFEEEWPDQQLRYAPDFEDKDDEDKVLYYLSEYFGGDHGLAFIAHDAINSQEDGIIWSVDNEQNTGLKIFGNELFAEVKGGTVTFDEDGWPTFAIKVAYFTQKKNDNDEYQKVDNFGTFLETFTAYEYGRDNYTSNDIGGAAESDFLGTFMINGTDGRDGIVYTYPMTIEDAGTNEAGETMVKISGMSGYSWDDSFYAEWYNGFLYVWPGETGAEYSSYGPISITAYDPVEESRTNAPLIGGFTDDGVLAFVGYPGYDSYFGLQWYVSAGWLGRVYNVYSVTDDKAAPAAKPAKKSGVWSLDEVNSAKDTPRRSFNAASGLRQTTMTSSKNFEESSVKNILK